jgi:hypothetical protein
VTKQRPLGSESMIIEVNGQPTPLTERGIEEFRIIFCMEKQKRCFLKFSRR